MDCDIEIYLYNLPWESELRMKLQHPLGWDRVMRNRSHRDTGSTSKLRCAKMHKTFLFPQKKKNPKTKNPISVYLQDIFLKLPRTQLSLSIQIISWQTIHVQHLVALFKSCWAVVFVTTYVDITMTRDRIRTMLCPADKELIYYVLIQNSFQRDV